MKKWPHYLQAGLPLLPLPMPAASIACVPLQVACNCRLATLSLTAIYSSCGPATSAAKEMHWCIQRRCGSKQAGAQADSQDVWGTREKLCGQRASKPLGQLLETSALR
jgi:hypothetical protein